jgi:predicted transcriptional regulator
VPKPGDAIISIHPRFTDAILTGSKTVELRRRIPPIEVGTRLWMYATRPIAAVVGSAIVGAIFRDTPSAIWDMYAEQTAIAREEFDQYFDGANEAIGISLRQVRRVRQLEIEELRTWREGFHPPQVLSKITALEAKRLQEIVSR